MLGTSINRIERGRAEIVENVLRMTSEPRTQSLAYLGNKGQSNPLFLRVRETNLRASEV